MGDEAFRAMERTHTLTGRNGNRYWLPKRITPCEHCGGDALSGAFGAVRRFCAKCRCAYLREKAYAGNKISSAIKYGRLKPATEYKCVDCDGPASVWEHRDYRKPLDIEPVCKTCNALRKGALWSGSKFDPLPAIEVPDCAAITLMGAA